MTKMTHTPGPWTVRSEPSASSGDDESEGAWFTLHAAADQNTFAEHNTNARLMAAAPELLEALKVIATYESVTGSLPALAADWRRLARAAIAKAEGNGQ